MSPPLLRERARAAFTLVEVAVAILIVGIALTMVLQSLNMSKVRAKQTQNLKAARQIGAQLMAEVSVGKYREKMDSYYTNTYEEDPDFSYEIMLGETAFPQDDQIEDGSRFDNWYTDDRLEEDEEEEEEAVEPYEKVRVRVSFPQLMDYSSQLELERWIPWDQVYGEEEEDLPEGDDR